MKHGKHYVDAAQLKKNCRTCMNYKELTPALGQIVPKCGHTKTPAQHDAVRARETWLQLVYWKISHPKSDLPGGEATLFLAGANHGCCEKAK